MSTAEMCLKHYTIQSLERYINALHSISSIANYIDTVFKKENELSEFV